MTDIQDNALKSDVLRAGRNLVIVAPTSNSILPRCAQRLVEIWNIQAIDRLAVTGRHN